MNLQNIMIPQIEDKLEEPKIEEQVPELPENKEEQIEEIDNPYVNRIESLYSEGILGIEELPEEFKGKEFNADTTIDLLEYVLKNKDTIKLEDERKTIFNEIVEGMSEITRKAYEYELQTNDPDQVKDFLKGLVFEQDIKALDPETNAEEIIREYHKTLGTPKAEVEETIQDLKELNKLVSKAKNIKPLLDEKVGEIASKKLEEAKAFDQMEKDALKAVETKLDKVFEKGIGIKLDKEKEAFIRGVLVNDEVLVPYKGKEIPLSGAEYLIRFHKFSKDGNLEHLVKTLLFLQYPEEFEKQYANKVAQTETQRFIKDHKVSSQVKAGIFNNEDLETKPKKGLLLR